MMELTEQDIDHIIHMSDSALYNKIYNAENYQQDIYPYVSKFSTLSGNVYSKIRDYLELERLAAKLKCDINYSAESKSQRDRLFEEYNMYHHVANIMLQALSDKHQNCNHKWEIYNEYDYETVYRCPICGKQKR